MSANPTTSCKTILAGTIAKGLLNEVTTNLASLAQPGTNLKKPHLLGILANDDPAAVTYAEWTGRSCVDKYVTFSSSSTSFLLHHTHRGHVYKNSLSPNTSTLYLSILEANKTSGFAYTLQKVSKDDVEETILSANNNPKIDGIIIYYPIFNARQDAYLQQIVSLQKDVEGLSHLYIFNMYQNIRFLDEQ